MDTPTGATIVCTFGVVLVAMFLIHLMLYHGHAAEHGHELKGAGARAYEAEATEKD
jgi:hypothetical protein